MMNRERQLAVGNWVKGKTTNGELIRGYIESIDSLNGTVTVYVVECDNDQTVGKSVVTPGPWLENIPVSSFTDEDQIRDLIDLALVTRDKDWFMELSAKVTPRAKRSGEAENRRAGTRALRNRLGSSAIWE
jgi:hypothetical protein